MFLEESSENWTQLKYGKNRNLKCFISTTAFPMKLSIIVCLTILSPPIGNRLSYLVYVILRLTKYPASKGAQ